MPFKSANCVTPRPGPGCHTLDCGPELRQSEFGHSSAKGEGDVRRAETKMGPLVGRVPAASVGADEDVREREGPSKRARGGTATVVLVEAAGRATSESA